MLNQGQNFPSQLHQPRVELNQPNNQLHNPTTANSMASNHITPNNLLRDCRKELFSSVYIICSLFDNLIVTQMMTTQPEISGTMPSLKKMDQKGLSTVEQNERLSSSNTNDLQSPAEDNFNHVAEDAARRREVRLLKNREAARECRRKKKEYIKCLENRVHFIESSESITTQIYYEQE